jgi:hypothetical protein
MTPRSLFNIIIKILGIFFIKDFLVMLSQSLSTVSYFMTGGYQGAFMATIVGLLLMVLTYGAISYLLIFKTAMIIDKLQLDKGFDVESIQLNIHRSTVLSIALIVIGGYIIADEIPGFIKELIFYFQYKRTGYNEYHQSIAPFIVSVVKIIIGYFLLRERKLVVNLIEGLRKN